MKIKLKVVPGDDYSTPWTKSLPFFLSDRAILVHRVESVMTHRIHRRPHTSVTYLCNGSTTADGVFLNEPPPNRLLCQACELAAKRKNKPSADELVGRHVHLGRIRVGRACDCEDLN